MLRHYTYFLLAGDPWLDELMDQGMPWGYVGLRTCSGRPENDPYMSSSEYIKAAMLAGIKFNKEIVTVHKTRKEASQMEITLLKDFKRPSDGSESMWSYLFNRVVPGEFGDFDHAKRRFKAVAITARKKGYHVSRAKDTYRGGGPRPGYHQAPEHVQHVREAITGYWAQMRQYCDEHGIASPGKGACNVDRDDFAKWRALQQ